MLKGSKASLLQILVYLLSDLIDIVAQLEVIEQLNVVHRLQSELIS